MNVVSLVSLPSAVCCHRLPGGVCVKGDPGRLHGSLVRSVPQGKDPRDPRITHGYTQPLTEEGATPTWNPILLTHGPGHPHQLSCGR